MGRVISAVVGVFSAFLLITAVQAAAVPATPLEAADLGAGVFAPEDEFAFNDPENAPRDLLSFLETAPGPAGRLRAIGAFVRRFRQSGLVVPKLIEVLSDLRASRREEAQIEQAFLLGLLAQEDVEEARAGHLKEIESLAAHIPRLRPADPWGRLVTAMLFASFPELHGNWLDEALYAQCHGYDSAEALLAVGSFMLHMDLHYGGNERLQWFIHLAFSRAEHLEPENEALRRRIRDLVSLCLGMPGYRPSKWIKAFAGL